ncbi:hypothetical protein GOQ27_03695, partial [Clostridium sp. D2Q-11]
YMPEIGRFISEDPWPGTIAEPVTMNPYPYVKNNPLRYIDPSGMLSQNDPGDGVIPGWDDDDDDGGNDDSGSDPGNGSGNGSGNGNGSGGTEDPDTGGNDDVVEEVGPKIENSGIGAMIEGICSGVYDFSQGVGAAMLETVSFGQSSQIEHEYGRNNEMIYLLGKLATNAIIALASLKSTFVSGGLVFATSFTGVGALAFSATAAASIAIAGNATGNLIKDSIRLAEVRNSGNKGTNKLGKNGTQVNSKTVWQNGRTERIDVENPSPGKRPGQIHYHESNNTKWYYDVSDKVFYNQKTGKLAPKKIQKILRDNNIQNAIKKALNILGE